MDSNAAGGITAIKREFARTYSGGAHIQEALPDVTSDAFSASPEHLGMLHKFAESNPIYHNSFSQAINGTNCTVYEGDINEYWLGSIKHGSSCQPFYPTWIFSAFVLASIAAKLGCTDLVDIGSGDGRIAFCGALVGLNAYSIEIDGALVDLQQEISRASRVGFTPLHADALEVDYASMGVSKPAFVVGGLPQMGGEMLAEGLLDAISKHNKGRDSVRAKHDDCTRVAQNTGDSDLLFHNSMVILAGQGDLSGPAAKRSAGAIYGWDSVVERYGLRVEQTVELPTVWTFDRDEETPYIFTKHGLSP